MKIVIWGAGDMGQRVIPYIEKDNIVAYIDSNVEKIGTLCRDIPVISIDEYIENFSNLPILISPLSEKEIEVILQEKGINFYYRLSDCPSEFSNVEYSSTLEDFCMRQIVKEKEFAIYGESLFSIILNEWIKKNKGFFIPIIFPKNGNKKLQDIVRKSNSNMDFFCEKDFITTKSISYLVTDEWYIKQLIGEGVTSDRIINLYDISDREESYYYPEIEKFKNIHKGESCFIIGHGPSLRTSDLDILDEMNIITFSMNWTFKLFDKTKWKPDYYVAMDRKMIDRYSEFKWENYTKRKCFIADASETFWRENKSTNNIKYHSIRNMRNAKFSDDVSRRVYFGNTVAYDCLQIAAYMGFKTIYLLGMDLVPYDKEDKSAYKYSNFFEQENQNSPQMWVHNIIDAYEVAKRYGELHNIHIYNATRGGYLEVFERVNFDELFI